MDALSLHFSFQLVEDPIASKECWELLHELPSKCIGASTVSDIVTALDDRIHVSSSKDGSHLVMHVYKHGLVTIDIQFVGKEPYQEKMSKAVQFQNIKRIENEIKAMFGDKCQYTRIVPARLKRGEVCPYFLKGDEKMYEFESSLKLLTEVDSKWQNIKIYDTDMYGAILVLDNEINELEADDNYHDTLFRPSCNSYKDKTVLLLGGGGGMTLQYLLEFCPKYVVMTEVLIDDCHNVLMEYQKTGEKFDYVVNDLSEYVINSNTAHMNDHETATHIMTESLKVLKQDGKYLSRGCGLSDNEFGPSFERDIINHPDGLTFQRFDVYIPIFNEKYSLYEVTRKK